MIVKIITKRIMVTMRITILIMVTMVITDDTDHDHNVSNDDKTTDNINNTKYPLLAPEF